MIGMIIKWGLLIAVVATVVTNPSGSAGFIVKIVSGIVTFFKTLIQGVVGAF